MSRRIAPFALLLMTACAAGVAAQSGAFRIATEIVPVFVTVQDAEGRLVTTLTRDQFALTVDGRPQPIVVFDNTPQPLQLVVLIDLSGSMEGRLPLLRRAAEALVARLDEQDVAKIGTFGREIAIGETFTRDRVTLLASLPVSEVPNAPTPLWRAVRQAMAGFEPSGRRRVVLVLSDGRDSSRADRRTGGFVNPLEITAEASRDDVMIYGVRVPPVPGSLQEQIIATVPDPWLERVTSESGGGHFDLVRIEEIRPAFDRVMDELRSQYLLGFAPAARDDRAHRIDVRLTERGLTARARRSYQVPAALVP